MENLETTEVNQDEMAESFFSDTEIVDQETGEEIPEQQEAEEPSAEEPSTEEPTTEEKEESKEPEKQESKIKDFFLKQTDDGESSLDTDKLTSVLGTEFDKVDTPTPEPEIPTEPEKSEIELEFEREEAKEKELAYLPKEVLRVIREDIQAGYGLEETLNAIENNLEKHVAKELKTWRHEQTKEKELSARKSAEEGAKISALKPRMEQNMTSLMNQMKVDAPTFNSLMYDKKYAGQDIQNLFEMQNPKAAGLKGEAYTKELDKWFTQTMSDPRHAQYLGKLALLRLEHEMQPDIAKRIRTGKDQHAKTVKRAAVKSPKGAETAKAESKPKDEMNMLLDQIQNG